MANFTTAEILSHRFYKEAWDIYDLWFQNGRKWPKGFKDEKTMTPREVGESVVTNLNYVAWQAGAWSACDTVWRGEFGIAPRTPPLCLPEQEQLRLFD